MAPNDSRPERLEKQLLARMDPSGELAAMIRAFDNPVGRFALRAFGRLAGVDTSGGIGALSKARQLQADMAEAIVLFAPAGWAPSGLVHADDYSDALRIYRETGSLDAAEQRLVESWNQEDRFRLMLLRVGALGGGDEELTRIALARADLVDKALGHHQRGAYEASVPIVLAQIDGIVSDLTGKGFFDGHDRHLFDNETILGMRESLVPLRTLFCDTMRQSGVKGSLSRHGILHGRELGYDTLINSTKVFVSLLAVTEWAFPRSQEEAKRRQDAREARFAGSDQTDKGGRRLDRRGLDDAREALELIATFEHTRFQRERIYEPSLDVLWPPGGHDILNGRDAITLAVSEDRGTYWAWRETPSGFALGLAAAGGEYISWYFGEGHPPTGPPGIDPAWRTEHVEWDAD